MYILEFLKNVSRLKPTEGVAFDYRLLCSGELYRANVATYDWRKSDVTRILFESPFSLVVCSRPFDEFPQELALRFAAQRVIEKHGNNTSIFHPDHEIARDLAALLTLLLRRFITVAAKIREVHSKLRPTDPDVLFDAPIAFVKTLNSVHWDFKPSLVRQDSSGSMEIIDYNPRPLAVDAERLADVLVSLPECPFAESIVLSARLYALALAQIERDCDLAYQLLISAVETTATEVLREYMPSEDEMITAKSSVAAKARELGLDERQARQLAIEACKGMSWASRKFTKFLVDNTRDNLWTEDDLYRSPLKDLLPDKVDYEKALKEIYVARGKQVHAGQAYPPSSGIGGGPTIDVRAIRSFDWNSKPFPPVVWFERVVNYALNTFVDDSHRSDTQSAPLAS